MKMKNGFSWQTIIRLEQTDASGTIFFNQIFQIIHAAYEEMLAAHGFSIAEIFLQNKFRLPIVHARTDIHRPISLGERLNVYLTVGRIGRTSFALHYQILDDSAQIVATAQTVHVGVSSKTGKKMPVPPPVRILLRDLMTNSYCQTSCSGCHSDEKSILNGAKP